MARHKILLLLLLLPLGIALLFVILWLPSAGNRGWTEAERTLIGTLWLGSLDVPPPIRGNAVADNPLAATLGERLFFDPSFSANGQVSCSTCHQVNRSFTDGLSTSVGIGPTKRNAMSLIGAAYSPWYFWDGRKDSLWSQALAPLENPAEQGGNRMAIARRIGSNSYREHYESIFGTLPDFDDGTRFPADATPVSDTEKRSAWEAMSPEDRLAVNRVFVNVGKSLDAYQRRLLPQTSRFDEYVELLLRDEDPRSILSKTEIDGLRIFIGRGQCVNCHNGPLLTNNSFHNTGSLPASGFLPSKGRSDAIDMVLTDPFNCLGAFSDRAEDDCAELRFMATGSELIGAHKTPSLRNVADTAPYMHAGQIETLGAVLRQYNLAPAALIGHNEAKPLGLSAGELRDLEAFLRTLSTSETMAHAESP